MEPARKGIARRTLLQGAACATAASVCTASRIGGSVAQAQDTVPRNPTQVLSCDIVVCGTGTAGTCATLRAAELGAHVITLETRSNAGGTSRVTEGVFGCGDRLCQELGTTVTPNEIFKSVTEYAHFASNGPVLRTFVDHAGETIDWLMDNGIAFTRLLALGGSPAVWHTFDEGCLVGEMLIDPLIEKATSMGAEIIYDTTADQLLTADDGSVAGVLATMLDGSTIQVNAPVVILCCGGFSDNAEMFQKYVGRDLSTLFNNGMPGRNGEGIAMGLSAGAALHIPSTVMYNGGRVADTAAWYSPVNLAFYRQFNMRVNENGQRYWNEARVGDFTAHGNSILAQLKTVSIIDQAFLDTLTNVGLYYGTATMGYPTGAPVPEMPQELAENPHVVKADTIEEIADAFGIDPQALVASVERYNGFCATGIDEDFGKPADFLQPVSTPPFYAVELIPSFFTTVGGLKVDPNIRVVRESGEPIRGLYACGSDAGGVYGHCYDVSAASGSQQGWAATSAKLAVEHAVENLLA